MSKILQAFLKTHQLTMQTSLIEINSIVVIKELLRAEPMLTLLPEHIVADEIKNGSLIEIPFVPSPEPLVNYLIYTNHFQRLDLVEFIKQETKSILV